MARLKVSDEWWTSPSEGENGELVIVTVRENLENVIVTGKYEYRVEVTWRYQGDTKGMPLDSDSGLMEKATDALNDAFNADPVAVMTEIYTGAGERNWVFYTRSLHIFQRKFNEALACMPDMPLEFDLTHDPDWEEYKAAAPLD